MSTKSYCDVCEREFRNESALQSHLANSKEHKKWERKQRSEQARSAQQLAASTAPSVQRHFTGFAMAVVPDPANLMQFSAAGNFSTPQTSAGTLFGSSDQQRVANGTTGNRSLFNGWGSFQHGNNHWSVVPTEEQQATLDLLAAHCHTAEDLEKNQYVLRPYGPEELDGLWRCKNCNGELLSCDLAVSTKTMRSPEEEPKAGHGVSLPHWPATGSGEFSLCHV
jgi:hypothetical protein